MAFNRSKAASEALGNTISGSVTGSSILGVPGLLDCICLSLKAATRFRIFLDGMSSSGELSVESQTGHALFSDSSKAVRAQSSHTSHAHCGINTHSLKSSLHTGQIRSSGISCLFEALAAFESSSVSQTGLSTFGFW